MQTTDNSNSRIGSKALTSGQMASDYINGLELQLKDLWSQYVSCLDKYGLNETAQELKKKYLQVYNGYRNNKNWREIINND